MRFIVKKILKKLLSRIGHLTFNEIIGLSVPVIGQIMPVIYEILENKDILDKLLRGVTYISEELNKKE